MSAITVQNFSYAYQHPHKVLDHITLHVESGSFTALLGPSGAGKTSLCLAVAGAIPHYFGGSLSGTVTVGGTVTTDSSMPELACTVGSVLQDYEIQLVTMTVEEEIAFSLENQGMSEADIARCTRETLAAVGLTGYEKAEVASLSGGQKQRLAIGSVLAANPSVLVLDEPSSALDPEGTATLYQLLGALNKQRGLTILVVEHNITQLLPYADQFILLDQGKVVQAGSPETVLTTMWTKSITPEALPPLWQLKLSLEAQTGCKLAAWRNEQEAIDELMAVLAKEARHYA
jgi:energy-coupling factor transport system ATP-binding protein